MSGVAGAVGVGRVVPLAGARPVARPVVGPVVVAVPRGFLGLLMVRLIDGLTLVGPVVGLVVGLVVTLIVTLAVGRLVVAGWTVEHVFDPNPTARRSQEGEAFGGIFRRPPTMAS